MPLSRRAEAGARARLRAIADVSPVVGYLDKARRLAPTRTKKLMGRTVAYWKGEAAPHVPVAAPYDRPRPRSKRKTKRRSRFTPTKARRSSRRQHGGRRRRGQLKRRLQAFAEIRNSDVRGGLLFGTHYAIWLLVGTRDIAEGRVMRWSPGKPTVKDWPAKRAGGNPRGEMPIGIPWRAKYAKQFKRNVKGAVIDGE